MPVHQPIRPARAIELVEARNLARARSVLADYAAAGLIKTCALMREIRPVDGPSETVRDSQIPQDEWERIVTSGNVDVALNGGTVRLEGSTLKGGAPSVQITGVSFSESSLVKVLDRYCAQSPGRATKQPSTTSHQTITKPSSRTSRVDEPEAVPPIKQEDFTASVAQTMQATSLGRTKIDQLMREGKLVRTKVGKRTLITVQSIERLIGTKVDV